MNNASLDLDRLLRLRLAVARFGEMDCARWWNTSGQLGHSGTIVLRRGFPRTHRLAAARSVFAVASHRCREIYDAPRAATLWWLTPALEDEFDARWSRWLENATELEEFFGAIESITESDPAALLLRLGLVSEPDLARAAATTPSDGARWARLPGTFAGTDADVTALALGFSLGRPGALVVPHMACEAA